jgi:BirA family biotin operon repressor/biotin-[acetyl-CoA-carboxylase] ligase
MQSRAHPYERLAGELGGSPFSSITYVAETGSTNDDAAKLLGDPRHFGLSIVAERQTRGSGRKGRTWIDLPGTSLLVTTVLPQAIAAPGLWAVPFWTALALRSALARNGVATTLHWPNDLLVPQHGKVAGILCVSRVTGEAAWVACGIGVNVRRSPAAQAGIEPAPAFCDDVASVDRARLLLALLREYDASLDLLSDPRATAARWESAAGLPGARYRILRDGENDGFEAVALRLADDGGLVVERDGRTETVNLADARALR